MALPLEQIKVKLWDVFIYSVGTLRVLNLEKLICILRLWQEQKLAQKSIYSCDRHCNKNRNKVGDFL